MWRVHLLYIYVNMYSLSANQFEMRIYKHVFQIMALLWAKLAYNMADTVYNASCLLFSLLKAMTDAGIGSRCFCRMLTFITPNTRASSIDTFSTSLTSVTLAFYFSVLLYEHDLRPSFKTLWNLDVLSGHIVTGRTKWTCSAPKHQY